MVAKIILFRHIITTIIDNYRQYLEASGYFMGNSRNNQPGGLYTSLVDVGNRVHTRNDSDEDVRGNAYKQTIAWRALPWSFIMSHTDNTEQVVVNVEVKPSRL